MTPDASVNPEGRKNWCDQGYRSNEVGGAVRAEREARRYCSERDRGQRRREGKAEAQAAVYANRRRIRGGRGKRLLQQRGEWSFAHL